MKKFLNIIIILYIFNYHLNYIVYPINVLESNNIESLLSFNSTYTTLEIGTPSQNVNFYFSLEHNLNILTNKGCKKVNLFNQNKSSTFKIVSNITTTIQNNNKFVLIENLYLHYNINLLEKVKVNEYLFYTPLDNIKNEENICGNIGLSLIQYEIYKPQSPEIKHYLDKLKRYSIESNDDFSFLHYKNNDYLIYGVYLNNEFPELFKDLKELQWVYPILDINKYHLHWEITMKEIYYNNNHLIQDKIPFELNPIFELIVGTNNYEKNITKDYFNFYIKRGVCSLEYYKKYNFKVFECEGNKFTFKDINKFPTLFISNIRIHYTFELIGKELFFKLNNRWYFNIVFFIEKNEPQKWILGRTFLRKYPVTFSPSSRLISFYVNSNNDINTKNDTINNKEKKKNIFSNHIIGYIKIILIALIFTFLGLYIGKKIYLKRKKLANELIDDDYQYDSQNRNENKNIKIEMKSRFGIK